MKLSRKKEYTVFAVDGRNLRRRLKRARIPGGGNREKRSLPQPHCSGEGGVKRRKRNGRSSEAASSKGEKQTKGKSQISLREFDCVP